MELYLEYWFTFFFIFPILEWGLHYLLHILNNKMNNNHHTIVINNRLNKTNSITL